MDTRVHRLLEVEDIQRIAQAYHTWRTVGGAYEDVPGFCKSEKRDEIEKHGFVLTPGRYVRAEEVDEQEEKFDERMSRLTAQFSKQTVDSARIDHIIRRALTELGYE